MANDECVSTILAIATAVPAQVMQQCSYPDYYFRVTNSEHMANLKDKFRKLCEGSGIERKHMALTEEYLKANPSMCEYGGKSLDARQALACAETPKIAKEAADKAIKKWGEPMERITHLVFATSSSVDMPGADVALANLMGLRASVRRLMVNMQGCSTAGMLLRVAKDMAENKAGARVLVVCGDLGSVAAFRAPCQDDIPSLVGQTFFGDGMSALIVGSPPFLPSEAPLFQIHGSLSYLIPHTQASCFGHVTEAGMTFSISSDFADLVSSTISHLLSSSPLLHHCLGSDSITPHLLNSCFWAVHAGGRKSLDLLELKLQLTPDKLKQTRAVLSENGNMGACTAFFALERLLKDFNEAAAHRNKWGFLVGYGPGINIEIVILKACIQRD